MGMQHWIRASELMARHRYVDAERELRGALADEPNDEVARRTLARVLCSQDKHMEALIEADMAVGLAPDDGDCHFTRALVLLYLDREKEALPAIEEAIRLQPEDAGNRGLQARILLNLNRPADALTAAEFGLAIEAEHTGCENARSQALTALGRPGDALDSIRRRLARDPNDDISHYNLGDALLRSGESEKAAEHFREALRLDPTFAAAREGLALSLKSRSRLYSLGLRALLAFARLPPWIRWGGIIFVYGGAFLTKRLSSDPYVQFAADVVVKVFFVFWMVLCAGDALFTLALRADRKNRSCLSDRQIAINNIQLPLLAAMVLTLALWTFIGQGAGLALAGVLALTLVAVSGAFDMPEGRPRRLMATYVAAACVIGVIAAVCVSRPVLLLAVEWRSNELMQLFLSGPRIALVALLMLIFDDNVAAWLRKRHFAKRYGELSAD